MYSRFCPGYLYMHRGRLYVCAKTPKDAVPRFRTFPDLKVAVTTISLIGQSTLVCKNAPHGKKHPTKTQAKIATFIKLNPELFI